MLTAGVTPSHPLGDVPVCLRRDGIDGQKIPWAGQPKISDSWD